MKDIKVELFTLCQGAHNMNGNLTIVNTIDNISVPSFPARITFGLALKLYIQPEVEGNKLFIVSIVDKSESGLKLPRIPCNLHVDKMSKPSHINIALNLQNVLFEKAGNYDIHLEVNGERLDDFEFEVIQK